MVSRFAGGTFFDTKTELPLLVITSVELFPGQVYREGKGDRFIGLIEDLSVWWVLLLGAG